MLASPPNECEECGAYWYDNDGHCCLEWKKWKKAEAKCEKAMNHIKRIRSNITKLFLGKEEDQCD